MISKTPEELKFIKFINLFLLQKKEWLTSQINVKPEPKSSILIDCEGWDINWNGGEINYNLLHFSDSLNEDIFELLPEKGKKLVIENGINTTLVFMGGTGIFVYVENRNNVLAILN